MDLKHFFRQWIFNAASAFVVWFALALCLEYLIPGFATPFVDLADMSLLVLVAVCIGVSVSTSDDRRAASRVFASVIFFCAAAVVSLTLLWFALNGATKLDMLLLASGITISTLLIYAVFFTNPNER